MRPWHLQITWSQLPGQTPIYPGMVAVFCMTAVLCVGPLLAQSPTTRSPRRSYTEALRRRVSALKELLKQHPRDARLHLELADDLASHELFPGPDALVHYRAALFLDSSLYGAAMGVGQGAWFSDDYPEAVRALTQAVKLAPDSLDAYDYLGDALRGSRRYDESVAVYDTLIARRPDSTRAYRKKVDVLVEAGRLDDALRTAQALIQRRPGRGSGYWALADAQAAFGNEEATTDAYETAILAENQDFSFMTDLDSAITVFRSFGALARLTRILEQRVAAHPDDFITREKLATLLNEQKHPSEALPHWRTLIADAPRASSYHFGLGSSLFALESYEEALRAFTDAASLDTTFAVAYFDVGASAAHLNRFLDALRGYQRAALANPRDAETWLRLGSTAVTLRRPAEAVAYFERGLRENAAIFDSLTYFRTVWEGALKDAGQHPPASDDMLRRSLSSAPATPVTAGPPTQPARKNAGAVLVATGSGVLVGSGSNVTTNAHVIAGCARITARGDDGYEHDALVQASDKTNDLALLRVGTSLGNPMTLRVQPPVRSGEDVVVMGYPLHGVLADQVNVTTGTISALAGLGNDTRLYQITAPVQPGNSGGPLLDASGALTGLVVSKLDAAKVYRVTGDVPQNINFAIKGTIVAAFLEANGVHAEAAPSFARRPTSDIVDVAKSATVLIQCYR